MAKLSLTAAEASFVLDRSVKAINKAVDDGVIRAGRRKVGNRSQRVLGAGELRFLRLADELRRDLTPLGQRRVYEAVRALPADVHEVALGSIVLDIAPVDADLSVRLERLDALRTSVELRGDDLVIRGTTIPVHLVAALAQGQTQTEIVEDYPALTPAQVAAAIDYSKAFPKRGRPYPTRSLKRMIGDAAAAGAFDDDALQTPVA